MGGQEKKQTERKRRKVECKNKIRLSDQNKTFLLMQVSDYVYIYSTVCMN